jgi:O-antigen/teichoic acid export membrane protein
VKYIRSETLEETGTEKNERVHSGEPLREDFFDAPGMLANLKERSIRGGVFMVGGQAAITALRIVSTIVLTRLLDPKDFGLIAMVMVITGFAEMFQDMGLSDAAIQRKDITHHQVSNLFWINISASFALSALTIVIAPFLALFYNEPQLLWITIVLSVNFMLTGFGIQHMTLMKRQMRFGEIILMRIIAMSVGIIVGVVTALSGGGAWSLVFMTLASSLTNTAEVWRLCVWRPGWPVRSGGIRQLLAFGGNLTGFNIVLYFAQNMDSVLLGRYCGAAPLGLYNRASSLSLIPSGQIVAPISAVAVPTLSRLQDDPERYRRYYLKAISLIALVTMPGVIFLIIMADGLIRLAFGEKWLAVSGIFAVLGINGFIRPILSTTGWLFVSTGQADRMFKLGIVWSICIVGAFFAGLPYGPIGVATAYTVCLSCLTIPAFWYSCKTTPIKLSSILKTLLHPAIAALGAGCILVGYRLMLPVASGNAVGLLVGLIMLTAVYLGFLRILAGNWQLISEAIEIVRSVWRKKLSDKERN